MIDYKLETTISGQEIVRRTIGDIETIIPIDEANSDYQRYLRWLENPDAEEGGTL